MQTIKLIFVLIFTVHNFGEFTESSTISNNIAKRLSLPFNQPNKNYQKCVTPSGRNGHCKHVRHCLTIDMKSNFWKFFDYFCVIESSAIGICCADEIGERIGLLTASFPSSGDDFTERGSIKDEEDDHAGAEEDPQERGCGVATKQFPKIAGGRPADPGEYPWMAALTSKKAASGAFCGGVLITDRHVLTAAHCWGTQFFAGPHSPTLMEVTIPIWKNEDCQEKYTHKIHDSVLCAGANQADSCQGDSGGPLMIQLPNKRWTVIGIVSWGVRCGEPKHPGIYTRVSNYIEWIIENATF
ncbi:CLUMA_CG015146, isoform A [Clunio marinus]|uniref:CLUMA_CG015146, isoform A n=1 Tax=Clunio marinus TaxID=568069 RepID=A0A1J1ITL0_9DIPT|nr:CLUMA_CG015146, isoform A [Clunio marinus]